MRILRLASTWLFLPASLIAVLPARGLHEARATSVAVRVQTPGDHTQPSVPQARRYRVAIGGYSLNMVCSGTGSPTVVFESGDGDTALAWSRVMPNLAPPSSVPDLNLRPPSHVRYCAYDRAGNGLSDPGPLPRDSKTIVRELHTLLTRAGIDRPYVLVAHSLGGLYVRMYAYTYPSEVVGMILVDSSYEDQLADRGAAAPTTASCKRNTQCLEVAAWPADQAEGNAARRARGAHPLGNMPLVVLTATAKGTDLPLWLKWQNDLATLSTDSRHLLDPLSDHFIQDDQPDFVIEALQRVIYAVYHHTQLPPVRDWLCGDGTGHCR